MSKIALSPNASGTALFTIASPATNTDRTLTLPDEAGTLMSTGTSLVASQLPSGSVIQTVSFNTSSQGSASSAGSDVALSPDITKSITPVASGSSFLIQVRWNGEVSDGSAWNSVFNIHRDGSRINAPGTSSWQGLSIPKLSYYNADFNSTLEATTFMTLDTTGSTAGTAIAYRVVWCTNGSSYTIYTNRVAGSTGTTSYEATSSEIIISEIKG
jgi:hypothetical protein